MKDQLKKILTDYQLKPKDRLGQNFLVDQEVVDEMVNLANVSQKDKILEVGPGLGFLTELLVDKSAQVVGVEIDEKLSAILNSRIQATNLKIVNKDILKVEISDILASKFKVVSSLPYQISSPFIKKVIMLKNRPQVMVLLLQLEVGQRLSARPGSSERGLLSVIAQAFFQVEIKQVVGPGSFYPQPSIDSAIVHFKLRKKSIDLEFNQLDGFINFVGMGFRQKRKKLVNSLANQSGYSKEEIVGVLTKFRLDPNLRAEDLTVDDWLNIYSVTR